MTKKELKGLKYPLMTYHEMVYFQGITREEYENFVLEENFRYWELSEDMEDILSLVIDINKLIEIEGDTFMFIENEKELLENFKVEYLGVLND